MQKKAQNPPYNQTVPQKEEIVDELQEEIKEVVEVAIEQPKVIATAEVKATVDEENKQ